MNGVKAALYVDFDNVVSGLRKLSWESAVDFAEHPERWVGELVHRHTTGGPRRWVVQRCYLNSTGSITREDDSSTRLSFGTCRSALARAGFEVIDCPPFFTRAKNAADIKMTLDISDALRDLPCEEVVVATSDSDFAPVLMRIRSSGRLSTLVSTSEPAAALSVLADRLVTGAELANLARVSTASAADAARAPAVEPGWASFAQFARREYTVAKAPIHLSELGKTLRKSVRPPPAKSSWFGHASLSKALRALDLPHMRLSTSHVWDSTRHRAPRGA
jgi:hypothetical protein